MNHLIQPLEARRLMSTTGPIIDPIPGNIVAEPVHEFAGVSQTVRVGYIPKINVGHISQLHGTINWGDGTTSPAEFDRNKNGGIDIIAAHTYVKPGTFSITTSEITETPWAAPGQPLPQYILDLGAVTTTATVDPTPQQLTETAGKKFTAVMATFNQFTLDTYYTAVINWGDGVTTTAAVTGGDLNKGNWTISGTHTYQHAGDYQAHALIYLYVVPSSKGYLSQDVLTLVHVVG